MLLTATIQTASSSSLIQSTILLTATDRFGVFSSSWKEKKKNNPLICPLKKQPIFLLTRLTARSGAGTRCRWDSKPCVNALSSSLSAVNSRWGGAQTYRVVKHRMWTKYREVKSGGPGEAASRWDWHANVVPSSGFSTLLTAQQDAIGCLLH